MPNVIKCHKMAFFGILWHTAFVIIWHKNSNMDIKRTVSVKIFEIWTLGLSENQNTKIFKSSFVFWPIFLYKIKSLVAPVDNLQSFKNFARLPNLPIGTYIPIYRKIHESKGNRGTLVGVGFKNCFGVSSYRLITFFWVLLFICSIM